jgi:DNA helicase HerA-like ATPase
MLISVMNKNTLQDYLELNSNSTSLNKDRITKHYLDYFEQVMLEHLDRDMNLESQHVKELRLVQNYLTDLESLFNQVRLLQSQSLIEEDSNIIDECISASNCESYDEN